MNPEDTITDEAWTGILFSLRSMGLGKFADDAFAYLTQERRRAFEGARETVLRPANDIHGGKTYPKFETLDDYLKARNK